MCVTGVKTIYSMHVDTVAGHSGSQAVETTLLLSSGTKALVFGEDKGGRVSLPSVLPWCSSAIATCVYTRRALVPVFLCTLLSKGGITVGPIDLDKRLQVQPTVGAGRGVVEVRHLCACQ